MPPLALWLSHFALRSDMQSYLTLEDSAGARKKMFFKKTNSLHEIDFLPFDFSDDDQNVHSCAAFHLVLHMLLAQGPEANPSAFSFRGPRI
jgi:hypothetical protein